VLQYRMQRFETSKNLRNLRNLWMSIGGQKSQDLRPNRSI